MTLDMKIMSSFVEATLKHSQLSNILLNFEA